MPAPLLAVDGPSLLYRSFFALPDSIRGRDGMPVGALLGSVNAILRVAADHGPRAIAVCFGAEAAAYRVAAYPAYHADRPPVPETLAAQLEIAQRDLLPAAGWTVADTPELEADDLLGALARVEAAAGGRTLIFTGDRDLYQCAGPAAEVLYMKTGVRGFERVDAAEVRRRYGIDPELVPDFIALRGDPSDGLPGARGIGAKTAADLLGRHGSLERAIAAADGERPRVAAALREQAAELRTFRDIALLRDATPIERPPDRETDLDALAERASALGMNRLAQRLRAADGVAAL